MTLDPAAYWRLRYLQAESEKAMLAAAAAESRYRLALAAAGVPPEVEHQWHDGSTSLVPVAGGAGLPVACASHADGGQVPPVEAREE